MQSKVEPSTRKERLLTLNAGTKKAQNISIFWLTLSPSTWLFYALEIRTAVPSGFTEFIAKTQSAVNKILHAATAVSPRATSQGTAMFSLITAMDWPSFFFLNANAVGQSKQGKRDRYNKLHCLWILYCYLFDTIRTSGKRPLVLALFTSKNANRRRQVTPEVSRLAVFQMACQNLMSATRSLMSDPRLDCTWKLGDRSLIDFTLIRSMNVKICRCFWTQLSKSFCFFTKLQAVIKNLGGKRRNLGNVRAVWNPFVEVFNKPVFSPSRALS